MTADPKLPHHPHRAHHRHESNQWLAADQRDKSKTAVVVISLAAVLAVGIWLVVVALVG